MAMTLEESIRKQTHDTLLSWLVSRQTFWVSCAVVFLIVMALISGFAFRWT